MDSGFPLTEQQLLIAKGVGVNFSKEIRICLVNKIPIPPVSLLKEACAQTGLITENTIGLALRHGIYIRQDQITNLSLYAHELKHVSQYEKLGSIENFLNKYLEEVLIYGYDRAPMELEAKAAEAVVFTLFKGVR